MNDQTFAAGAPVGQPAGPMQPVPADKTLWQYFIGCFKPNYANFKGRARRSEYWGFSLFLYIINGVVYGILGSLMGASALGATMGAAALSDTMDPGAGAGAAAAAGGGMAVLWIILMVLYGLAIILPTLAVTVRRLHDIGKSGWFWLLNLIPFIGSIIILVFTIMDSQPGANKWGNSQKYPAA